MMESGYKVLVLEDDPELRETLAELLEEEGYTVVAVSRGEEAVQQASRQAFDLIVSDIRMDGMDGLEAIDQASKLQPSMGSLVVSGYASERETLRAIRLNVGGYLRKPFSLKEFLQAVRAILEKQTAQLRVQREMEGYQQALGWAMQTLAELGDEYGYPRPGGGLVGVTRLTEALGRAVGLGPEAARRSAWITEASILTGSRAQSQALFSGPLRRADPPSLEGRLQALAQVLWSSRGEDPGWPSAEKLGDALDPALRSAYQELQLSQGDERAFSFEVVRALSAPAEHERGLLALAEAMEESQDLVTAAHAYREAYERTRLQPCASTVQASLGLARLAQSQKNAGALEEWVGKTREVAAQLGPGTGSEALSEAGFLLSESAPVQAVELLRGALPGLQAAGQRAQAARTRLCLRRLGQDGEESVLQEDVRTLLEPAWQGEVARSWSWLLPQMLLQPSPRRALSRLLLDFSAEVGQLARAGSLPEGARENVLSTLEELEFDAPEEILQALLGDPRADLRGRATALRARSTGDRATVSLRLQSFGFFQVSCGAQKVGESAWRTQKVKYLLAYLAAAGTRRVGEDELLEEFWPEVRGKRNLYVATAELRRVLRPNAAAKEVDYVLRERGTLALNDSLPIWHDASDAENAWAAARAGDEQGALENYRRIATLYAGPYLEGCYMEWAVRRRAIWEERATQSYLRLSQQHLKQKSFQESLEMANLALGVDAGCLEAHEARLRSALGLRQPEAVIRHFEACEKMLKREFESEPSMAMLEIYQRARHGLFE